MASGQRDDSSRTDCARIAEHAESERGPAANKKPNIVIVFGDQWRAQATGYAGDPNVRTPHLDRLAGESINFTHAISGFPVCSPYRGSLITGQYPMTHGVFLNDVCLGNHAVSIAQACKQAGYQTAYIGKWHLDGHGRTTYIPPERRHGFELWEVLECTHDYNSSIYYAGNSDKPQTWEGYDAIAQTRRACEVIQDNAKAGDKPLLLMLSWGPPHNPYETAPPQYQAMYDPQRIVLRPNVAPANAQQARLDLAGYYAHCTALDDCVGQVRDCLQQAGIENDTIFLFTSDHGDMVRSHVDGPWRKQRPWDESIRVPFLLRYPARLGAQGRVVDKVIDAPDVMPTVLSLAGVDIPETVEGVDMSPWAAGAPAPADDAGLLSCYWPFGHFTRAESGREYRGLRTRRYTYVEDLEGPWLLYDNEEDPYQMTNLVNRSDTAGLQARLAGQLRAKLKQMNDEFLPGIDYVRKWGYVTDEDGNAPQN